MLNISSNLHKTEWLDLVFKNRNKNYGAYSLRSQSSGTTARALFIAAPLFVLFFAGPMIYKHVIGEKPSETVAPIKDDRVIDITLAERKIEKPKPQEKMDMPKTEPIKEKIKTVKPVSNPIVVDRPVLADPPTLVEMDHAAVGPVTQSGVETSLGSVPIEGTGNGIGTGSGDGNGVKEDNGIHDMTDIQSYPEFEGGMKAWAKFIQRNLRYPNAAQEVDAQGRVYISFVVEKDGSVSNVTVLRGIGYGCDEEAVRVISKSPKWKPGKQNDQNVRVRYNMPLSFTISR
ncbi:energy transducer TonB [Pedobacter foliorum]|uniref:energy transducer TonB n=1 Tax=Pedobacter foliorum TaxID=2739058 RepID=UPI001563D96C|nr:energy transducer TonB [Pedobacter foliorum]NRF41438.1 energy transducer TonB [Pedobacter foliorum]